MSMSLDMPATDNVLSCLVYWCALSNRFNVAMFFCVFMSDVLLGIVTISIVMKPNAL